MAITLGDLRTFTREIASPDSSGATAEREFMIWINSAIMRVFADNDWDKILHTRNLNILPEESGTLMGATQDSLDVTMVGPDAFLTKYVTDEWQFVVGAESSQTFQLASMTSALIATLRAGDEWVLATATGLSWAAFQNKYDLPDSAKTVVRVQILQDGGSEVCFLPAHEFDRMRSTLPTDRGSSPRWYTLRQGKIEIHPHPGTTRNKLSLTYRKGPTVLADADVDATSIDWDDEWKDLLYKAIQLEASITQGKGSPIPYELAKVVYEDRLRKYRALDGNKSDHTGPMGLRHPMRRSFPGDLSFSDATPILDVGP